MRVRRLSPRRDAGQGPLWWCLLLLLGCAIVFIGCQPGGDTGTSPTGPDPADPQFVQQGVQAVLDLYRTALLHEDIDRLTEILQKADAPPGASCQATGMVTEAAQAVQRALTRAFRDLTLTALQLTDVRLPEEATRRRAPTPLRVTVLESESVEDPVLLGQRTCVFATTLALVRDAAGTWCFAAVQRGEQLVEVLMRGQVVAGAPTRVEVRATSADVVLRDATLTVPETGVAQVLMADGDRLQGVITPPPPGGHNVMVVEPDGRVCPLVNVLSPAYLSQVNAAGALRPSPSTRILMAGDNALWQFGSDGGVARVGVPEIAEVGPCP